LLILLNSITPLTIKQVVPAAQKWSVRKAKSSVIYQKTQSVEIVRRLFGRSTVTAMNNILCWTLY